MTDSSIQDLEQKKQFLKRYKKNLALIDRLKDKVESLDARSKSIRSPSLSDMPRGGTPITYEDLIAEKDETIRRIERLTRKGRVYREEILDVIDELEDSRYAEVLEAFCIECKDFDTIAEENCYSVRHVERLYYEAILAVSI